MSSFKCACWLSYVHAVATWFRMQSEPKQKDRWVVWHCALFIFNTSCEKVSTFGKILPECELLMFLYTSCSAVAKFRCWFSLHKHTNMHAAEHSHIMLYNNCEHHCTNMTRLSELNSSKWLFPHTHFSTPLQHPRRVPEHTGIALVPKAGINEFNK